MIVLSRSGLGPVMMASCAMKGFTCVRDNSDDAVVHYKHVAIGIATKTQVNLFLGPACGFIIAHAGIL